MRKDHTHICCITDRSGSMSSIATEVIGGFNHFVEEQRQQPGTCTMTYVQFDDQYEVVFADLPLDQVPLLTSETFQPRGMTALLDAVGRTIVTTGERLAAMPEQDRPEKVICMIVTDGQENASHEYTAARVRDMVQHQTDRYSWEFIYLGADANAFEEARVIGVKLGNVARFANNLGGARAAYSVGTRAVSSYRAGGNVDKLVADSVRADEVDDISLPDDPGSKVN
jgi:hypothetical protein